MINENKLLELEGLHTVETVAKQLGITRQSALNVISKLKKQGYVTTRGGGKQKRLYTITAYRQRKRDPGMFDIINKYSPMKLNPWYDHQVHGNYGAEDALVDAVQTKSFRAILASLHLFRHIKDWKKLYQLAKEKDCWQQIGALYDLARKYFRVKKMPDRYMMYNFKNKKYLIKDYDENDFIDISRRWKVKMPFKKGDITKVISW